jgi:GTP-binding protein HflX
VGLAHAIDLEVAQTAIVALSQATPSTLIGKGKIEELKGYIAESEAVLVIINCTLTPVQQRNLEKAWECKVIDRTALILEIFGARARTHEGKLQVELAALEYQKSRLVRSWTHLERQRGGFGFLGGPGESQIEIDRLKSKTNWGRWCAHASCTAKPGAIRLIRWWHWWAIPTPANPPCSTSSPAPM